MYLLSQLWLYLVLACLAGAAFGFALRLLCARRAQAAQLQSLRDEAQRVEALHAAQVQQREAEHAAAATASAGAAALAHRQAVETLELRLAEQVAERDERDAALADVKARLSAAEAELAKREARLAAQARSLDETAHSAEALALERDAQRDQLLAALARQQDEAEAARRAHAQALLEQREAHAQAWAESEAHQAEQAERLVALQAALDAAQALASRQAAELDRLHATLRANDEQLAVLGARAESERESREALEIALGSTRGQSAQQQEACRQRIDALTAELERLRATGAEVAGAQALVAPARVKARPDEPAPPPSGPLPSRPPVSALALLDKDELARWVLAAGDGQAPMGITPDPLHNESRRAEHGAPDDLEVIDGIGPVNEAWLHQQGIWYFWQIAAWTAPEVAWVAHHLPNFGSRVYRENWVAQAARLAAQRDAGGAT